MRLSLIVAMSPNHVIGIANRLPWKMPADLRHFKQTTLGHTLIMGRKTYESIGRPLPGRNTIVVTRSMQLEMEGVFVANSLSTAFSQAEQLEGPDGEAFVAGGAQLYRQALDQAERIYMTIISGEFSGDTFFPSLDWSQWQAISRVDYPPDEKNVHPYSFLTLERSGAVKSDSTPS